MFQLLQERRSTALLTALFVISFTLMTLSVRRQGKSTLFEKVVLTLYGPFMEAASAPKRWSRDIWRRYIALTDLREENRGLRKQLSALQSAVLRAQELEAKVKRLERLLGARKKMAVRVRLANIVGRSSSLFGQTIIVDLGSADGVRRNMPVVHEEGVVGRIASVGQRVSKVILLTDFRSSVDVVVHRTRASGVFSVSPSRKGEVRFVPLDADIRVGDLLVSSGLGGIFPKGLPVAHVTQVGSNGDRLFQRVEARPTVNFNRLEEVLIMMVGTGKGEKPTKERKK